MHLIGNNPSPVAAGYRERVQKISPTRFELVASRLSNYSLTLYQLSYGELGW